MVAGAPARVSFQAFRALSRGAKSTKLTYIVQLSGFSSSTRWSWP